jgi:hypothetical protein
MGLEVANVESYVAFYMCLDSSVGVVVAPVLAARLVKIKVAGVF